MLDSKAKTDIDPIETEEWLKALNDIIREEGAERADYLITQLQQALGQQSHNGSLLHTPYLNTLDPKQEPEYPGNTAMEKKITALIRWNAAVMVLRAVRQASELGGHIASYASAAVLYEVGFNHFFKAANSSQMGDLIFIQGHSSPGIYARAFLEGRLSEDQLKHFRQEIDANGLSSYPHPWLMPDFWQFPTVSMGLGPYQAIYQARFMKYLEKRSLSQVKQRKVWAFCGDGEMDEPESIGGISIAAREKLDNLIFVINCNLQRLDGPVRGNGKVIQEYEGIFRGAGWNVIKVIWGRRWDPLLEDDVDGLLKKRMEEVVDGDYQSYRAYNGAYIREHFFGVYPELKEMVSHMSDEDIWKLNRGGHDAHRVYAAYDAAMKHQGQPTVILVKTVKGFGMGDAGEGQNITHNQKKMTSDELKSFRDRFDIPVSDEQIDNLPFYHPGEGSEEIQYLKEQRSKLGGYLPARQTQSSKSLKIPSLDAFAAQLKGTGEREISTTMAFVRIINTLLKDKECGPRVVPIVPDECRTFGMEGMFRQYGIYAPFGQQYTPVDSEQLMYYKEAENGQILEEGINEAGAFSSWIAAATAYSNHDCPMIPFYIYYSMFGFQRIGDFAWAAGDQKARGFLLGGTAGRTTLAGEGLQHQDGHSHIMAGLIPNCVSYDPTFSYELAVIIQDGLRRMYEDQEDIFYYITVMNENYPHPDMPKGAESAILKGLYLLQKSKAKSKTKVQLLGCGTILNEVIDAAKILEKDYKIAADIWSVTSFNELGKDVRDIERWNRLHPNDKAKTSYAAECLNTLDAPVIAASDYIQAYAEQIRSQMTNPYTVLGTDGYGRSDTRKKLRHFFEVDSKNIIIATLKTLADSGKIDTKLVGQAIEKFDINPDKPNPTTV